MAMKIKGITIELNADASGLEKALKSINKSLSDTQKDLRAVDKALKMDPKNIELIEQKERLLAKAITETTTKLNALKEAQANMKMDGTEEAQKQYDALTREISSTEQNLNKLNKEQENFTQQANEAKVSATGFGQALEQIESKANKVAQATAAMSAAAGTALAGLAAMTVNASEFADEMLTTAQQTGLSTDALQKMEYAAERVDVPMETIVSSIRKMKGHLDDNEATWQRLGVEVQNQSGQYRDIEDIFFDVVHSLGEIENETERDTLAMELFGRSADSLAGIIDDGGKHLRELGREAESLGAIVSEEDLQALGAFNDALEGMKAQLKGAAAQAAVPILQAMQPVIVNLSNAVRKFASVLSNLNPKLVQIGVIVLTIIASISPIAKLIASTASGIRLLISLFPALISGIQMISVALTSLMANPYALIIAGVVVAVIALAAAVKYCADNWDTLGPAIDNTLSSMKSGLNTALNSVDNLAKDVKNKLHDAFSNVDGSVGAIGSAITQSFQSVPEVIIAVGTAIAALVNDMTSMADKVTQVFNKMIANARKAGSDIVNAFTAGVRSVISNVTRVFQQMADSIKSIFNSTEQNAKYSGQRTAQNYVNGVNSTPRRYNSFNMFTTSPMGNSSPMNNYNSYGNELLSAVNTLNSNIKQMNASSATNVNVELVGSAKNIFDTVRVQNNQIKTATGYHALA